MNMKMWLASSVFLCLSILVSNHSLLLQGSLFSVGVGLFLLSLIKVDK